MPTGFAAELICVIGEPALAAEPVVETEAIRHVGLDEIAELAGVG